MPSVDPVQLQGIIAALGGGLLVGVERERSKSTTLPHESGGVRTFTLTALIGAIASLLGPIAIAVGGLALGAISLMTPRGRFKREMDLATKLSLLATYFLGALATIQPGIAAALFVVVVALLQSKTALHHFTRNVLSERELDDVLLLAASVLIVLPLLPNHAIDPWSAVNPRQVWLVAVLVITISAAGHVALRLFGNGRGLAIVGLLAGFVSSAATLAGMGHRAKQDPRLLPACVAASLLSCVATVVQLALVIGIVSPPLLLQLAAPLTLCAIVTFMISGLYAWRGRHAPTDGALPIMVSRFALPHALLFAGIVAASLLIASWLRILLGNSGVFATAAATGFIDVHAAAVSLANLATTDAISHHDAGIALAVAFTANSLMKCVAALVGGIAYARPVIGGVVLINASLVAMVWLGV
ncbi:MAG: DUF4010 domain-containing protein [Tahibacter sp.]